MADNTNTNETGTDVNKNGDGSQQRIEEMSAKVQAEAEARKKAEQDAANARKDASDARFQAAFAQVQLKPELAGANEFESEIKEKVAKGYSVEDAAFSVLRENNKLGSRDAGDRTADIAGAGGNSAAISSTNGRDSIEKKDPDKMTQEELRQAVRVAESSGQIKLVG